MIHEPHAWPKNILFTHAKDSKKGPVIIIGVQRYAFFASPQRKWSEKNVSHTDKCRYRGVMFWFFYKFAASRFPQWLLLAMPESP